jgi:hypothetical protein
MRPEHLFAGLALVLLLVSPACGQGNLYQATVQIAEAEVRCGHSTDPKMYVTNRLHRGDTVQVVKELEDGWLAIEPPRGSCTSVPPRGSYSWVNLRFLQRNGNSLTWTVVTHDDVRVPVLVGSPYKEGKATVVSTQLVRGTQVVGIGAPVTDEEGQWLPIESPPGEVRYVRKESVARTGAAAVPLVPLAAPGTPTANTAAAGSTAPPLSAGGDTPPALPNQPAPIPAPAPGSVDPLLQQAQAMEQANRCAEASQLYAQLYARYLNTNHGLAMQFHNRAEWLRQGRPGTAPDGRLYPVPSGAVTPSAPCPPAPYYPNRTYYAPAPAATQHSVSSQAISLQTSGAGRLRNASRLIDSRRAYLLESSQGQILMYVTEQPGVNLETYVDRNVELLGQIVPRGDIRPQYMTVARVIPLP